MDDVVDVAVWEGEQAFARSEELCDYCYSVSQTGRSPGWVTYDPRYDTVTTDDFSGRRTDIVWTVPALSRARRRPSAWVTSSMGAVEVDDDAQTFNWTIIFDEQDVPVESASVRIDLPPGIEPADVQVTGGTLEEQPDGSLLLVNQGPIAFNRSVGLQRYFAGHATAAIKPQWQQDVEAATLDAQAADARAPAELLFGGLALFLLHGLLSLLLIWYRWGRDEPVPLPAEYIPEPPSDLPPGIVAYLLDEKPSTQGALASLFHLATLGLLRIRLAPEINVRRNWDHKLSPGQTVETSDGRTLAIPDHLVTLFNDLSPAIPTGSGKTSTRSPGRSRRRCPRSTSRWPKKSVRCSNVARQSQQPVARDWADFAAAGFVFFGCFPNTRGRGRAGPGLSLLVVGIAWILASRWMPRRRPAGAIEAAKWRAFGAICSISRTTATRPRRRRCWIATSPTRWPWTWRRSCARRRGLGRAAASVDAADLHRSTRCRYRAGRARRVKAIPGSR